jgi:hypothetical protein
MICPGRIVMRLGSNAAGSMGNAPRVARLPDPMA